MPKWINPPLVVYHGTDSSVLGLAPPPLHAVLHTFAVNLARCSPNTDFGRGFYTTTSDHQARQWANKRVYGWHVAAERRRQALSYRMR
jgi:Protein of unknown function (DUF3990)